MKILAFAGCAFAALLIANMVAYNSATLDRAAAYPAPRPAVETAATPTTPIVPAEADGSGSYGYGPAHTTDW